MIDTINTLPPSGETTMSLNRGAEQKSQFLQLLVAQLKGQDPLNPMDGTQFASQLAQFSSLEELISIREVMENVDQTLQAEQEKAGQKSQSAESPF